MKIYLFNLYMLKINVSTITDNRTLNQGVV